MQKKVTLVLIATGLMLSSCVPLTVNSATISKVVSNTTIQDSNSVTYYRNDGVYFKLSMQSDSSSDYDNIGKFFPVEKLPNTAKFWIKRAKFFWCDKKKYKEFKKKVKREKIKLYRW